MTLAAIDIGTNSIHIVIAQATGKGGFEVLDREREVVQVGKGSFASGRLRKDAILRTVEALARFVALARRMGAERIACTATAAVREAQFRDVRGKWREISPDPFVCPVLGTTVSNVQDPKTIDYRGPAKVREQFRETPKDEPIGADRPGNHASGGFVLRLDTSVQDVPRLVDRAKEGDPLWGAAASALKD